MMNNLTSSSVVNPQKKKTYRVHINRTDTRTDPISNIHLQVVNKQKIIIEFQCDQGTKPELKPLMELE